MHCLDIRYRHGEALPAVSVHIPDLLHLLSFGRLVVGVLRSRLLPAAMPGPPAPNLAGRARKLRNYSARLHRCFLAYNRPSMLDIC